MLFNSWTFWVFGALVIPLYWRLSFRWQNRMLLAASYVFYGWWNWRFLFLIAGSTVMDYYFGAAVSGAKTKSAGRRWVALSVIANLLILGYFKYYNFFSREFTRFLHNLGVPPSLPIIGVVLPLGISFYTFQSMSYVIDLYRGRTAPASGLLNYALYVSFFPHLIAGPIMRSDNSENGVGLLKQIESPRAFRRGDFQTGLYLIALGLFKKVVIGDNLAGLVSSVFNAPAGTSLSGPECLAATWAFAIQIYADFSGYSSIAQGLARWMGIDLMINFRSPYLAVSPRDFWRRWHISLSTWLRDYVYIPLGGGRAGKLLTYRNLMITMLLGGLWHGANWTFIVWGGFHGLLLICGRYIEGDGRGKSLHDYSIPEGLARIFIMFNLACIGWIFFRAGTISEAIHILTLIFTDYRVTELARAMFGSLVFYAAPLLLFEYWTEQGRDLMRLLRESWPARAALCAYGLFMLIFFASPVKYDFIYFQF